ncbi:MAG: hypothetical protein ACOX2G_11910 [Bacillota bacterium]
MKKQISLILIPVMLILILAAVVLSQGCQNVGGTGISLNPPKAVSLWTEVAGTINPRAPQLNPEGGDICLEGLGEILGFFAIPQEDWQILALDWANGILGFYILDLHTRSVNDLGGIQFRGSQPKLETFAWPHALLSASDDQGNFSWVLVDLAEGKPEIAWESHAWVPQGLRRRPLWWSGETWYIGPISGPSVTDALSGKTVAGKPKYEIVNPVAEAWPRWAGGVARSKWYMYPILGGGSSLVDLETGFERRLTQDQEFVWNAPRTQVAWLQDGVLGVLDPYGKSTVLPIADIVPGTPVWSGNSDTLYFLGGEDNYFGPTWKTLWGWDKETGPRPLADLPGNWNRWRLLYATSEAVLAAAGENGEHLIYFDVANDKVHQLNCASQHLWQEGVLIALVGNDLLRLSPGFDAKVLAREAQDYTLLGMVNQFFIYSNQGKVYIKQLAL